MYNYPDSKTRRQILNMAINFWLQKDNKLYTEFVLSDMISKLLSEI